MDSLQTLKKSKEKVSKIKMTKRNFKNVAKKALCHQKFDSEV